MRIFAFYFYIIRHPIEWLFSLGIFSLVWIYASWMRQRESRKQQDENFDEALEENTALQAERNEQARKLHIAKVESCTSELRNLFRKEGLYASSAHVAFDEHNWPVLRIDAPDVERERAEALAKKFLGPVGSMKLF